MRQYQRAGIIPILLGLHFISESQKTKKQYFNICGTRVKFGGNRMATFLNSGTVCIDCGKAATHFTIDRDSAYSWYHVNLWKKMPNDGGELLFTSDHIRPISKGGKGAINNRQTMCCICNNKKGNKYNVKSEKPVPFYSINGIDPRARLAIFLQGPYQGWDSLQNLHV